MWIAFGDTLTFKSGLRSALRGLDTPGSFSAMFLQRRQLLWLPVGFSALQTPEKGTTLKGKNLLPRGEQILFF